MGLNTDKLVLKKQFREAGTIMMQSKIGTAKMYPVSKENLIELVKKGHHLDKLGTFFEADSIKAAQKAAPKSESKDESKNSGKAQK